MTFSDLARRKTSEAEQALLPAYVTEFERPPSDAVAVGSDWTRRMFDGSFYMSALPSSRRPACNLVFVQSLDGNTGATNPSALGGGNTDTHLIYEGLSRVAADAVMAGAETIRAGHTVFSVWHPELTSLRAALGKPRHPIQVVATLQGLDLSRGVMFNTPEIRVMVITVTSAAHVMRDLLASRPWITIVTMDRPTDLARAFGVLRERGVERLSCIGGRGIAAQLIDLGLVDDVYLTTSPRRGGEPDTPMYPGLLPRAQTVLRKKGTGDEAGVLFEHFSLGSD